jgi:hypothetical protein
VLDIVDVSRPLRSARGLRCAGSAVGHWWSTTHRTENALREMYDPGAQWWK